MSLISFALSIIHNYFYYMTFKVNIFNYLDVSEILPQSIKSIFMLIVIASFLWMVMEFRKSLYNTELYDRYKQNAFKRFSYSEWFFRFKKKESYPKFLKRQLYQLIKFACFFGALGCLVPILEFLINLLSTHDPQSAFSRMARTFNWISILWDDHRSICGTILAYFFLLNLFYDKLFYYYKFNVRYFYHIMAVMVVHFTVSSAIDKAQFISTKGSEDKIYVEFSSGKILKSSTDFFCIGQTKNAVFFYDKKDRRTIAYLTSNISSMKTMIPGSFY